MRKSLGFFVYNISYRIHSSLDINFVIEMTKLWFRRQIYFENISKVKPLNWLQRANADFSRSLHIMMRALCMMGWSRFPLLQTSSSSSITIISWAIHSWATKRMISDAGFLIICCWIIMFYASTGTKLVCQCQKSCIYEARNRSTK